MGGIKASEFEFASLTRGKMAPVEEAIEKMGEGYRAILSRQMHAAAARQQQLLEDIRHLDLNAAHAAHQLRAAPDYCPIAEAAEGLKGAVLHSRKELRELLYLLDQIDAGLPGQDKLLGPSVNRQQYPLISQLLEEKRLEAFPQQPLEQTAAAHVEASSCQVSSEVLGAGVKSAREALEGFR